MFPLCDNNDSSSFAVWALALYFGWLLSFPLYGPVLQEISPDRFTQLSLIFSGFHAAAFMAGGLVFRDAAAWNKMMTSGLSAVIAVSIIFITAGPGFRPAGAALLGASSAVFILGWSHLFVVSTAGGSRIKQMAVTILLSNLILQLVKMINTLLPAVFAQAAALAPLLIVFWLLLRRSAPAIPAPDPVRMPARPQSAPYPFILIPALFIFGLYLNSGFMYKVMIPTLTAPDPLFDYYRYIPYILILAVARGFADKIKLNLLIYMGISLLGLAFVSFALLSHGSARFFVTETIVQGAFALLDLFSWVLLAEMATVDRNAFRVFGFGLGSMLAGIFIGDLIGGKLMLIHGTYPLITALFAAAAIFLTILVIPWLNERILAGPAPEPQEPEYAGGLIDKIPLTAREIEIIELLLTGLSNREMAGRLYISENTLKTHLKNIYRKAGVTRKRELLSMALRTENHP